MIEPVDSTGAGIPAGRRHLKRVQAAIIVCFGFVCTAESSAGAAELYQNGDVTVRWDNTLRYSVAFRLSPRSDALISDPNADDGDRNFRPGIVSNRLDVLSEFEISKNDFGLRISAAGWYDTVYRQSNSNDSPATFNPISVPHTQFTRAVRTIHGEDALLSDAFVHGAFDAGRWPISFRIGRYALLWGESLYFAGNGIAAGQAPIDAIKESSEPSADAREIFLPVWQASTVIQPTADFSIDLYYQLEDRKDFLLGSGSYFSDTDYLGPGGERYILSPGRYLKRIGDVKEPGAGQYGVALQYNQSVFDVGLYALRFNAKEPQVYLRPTDLRPTIAGTYQIVYPAGIELYGLSFSSYLGDTNITGEISARRNMPLVSRPLIVSSAISDNHALYPIGNTLHAQMSAINTFGGGPVWDRAEFGVEVAANDVLSVTQNKAALDASRDRSAIAFQAEIEPQYFQVLPGLDLSIPISVNYGIAGKSSTDDGQNAGAGNLEVGLSATLYSVWSGGITLTHYMGSPASQHLADRDFISFSVQRTF